MNRLVKKLAAAVFCFVMTVSMCIGVSAKAATSSVTVTGTCDYTEANAVLAKLNALRESLGLDDLVVDSTLQACAMKRAAEIQISFSHTRPDGTECFTIMSPYGYDAYAGGENIAMGQNDASEVMNDWTNSSGHYANMTNSIYKSVGIGCFYTDGGDVSWVQIFSSKKGDAVSKSGTEASDEVFNIDTESFDINTPAVGIIIVNGSNVSWKKVSAIKTVTLPCSYKMTYSGIYTYNGVDFASASAIKCKSSDTSVVVSGSGYFKTGSAGTATLTFSYDGESIGTLKVVVKKLSAPAIKSLSVNSESHALLSWTKVTGASGYHIFRASSVNGRYTYVKNVTASKLSWTDLSTVSGKTYYYKVKAYFNSTVGISAGASSSAKGINID